MQNNGLPRWFFVTILLLAAAAVAGILLTRIQTRARPRQPIDFSHSTHTEAGVQCLYCHTSALRAPVAGIPSVEKCIGCHAVIASDSREIQKVAGYWEDGEPIPWQRVNRQPEFVYFSHQPHTGAGVACESCHGNVSQMKTVRPVVEMDMGWCLECHLDQPEEKVARLADCLACHK